jgi:dTDP-4-amino-4,6-dideoxygalactose transaminase
MTIYVEGTKGNLTVTASSLTVNGRELASGFPDFRGPQFIEFLRWVKGSRPDYAADWRSAVRATELILGAFESARLGAPITLPLKNRGDVIGRLYGEVETSAGPAPSFPVGVAGQGPYRLAMDGGRRAVRGWFTLAPSVGAAELAGLTRVILSKSLNAVGGREVPALEREFARAYGSPAAVASTSGTASIHVALAAINPEPCDEVITTPYTDMGSVIPILACNCIPTFADIDPELGNMTAETIARKITPRTRAVILVHLGGRPADLYPIRDLLRERGIALIEDCSQSHFAEYDGKKIGTIGDLSCFSLQESKQMSCGDGGMTLVNRDDLRERAALFVDKGWDRARGVRAFPMLGMNYRMTELQGAVARAQLRKLPAMIAARRRTADLLTQRLGEIPGIITPPQFPGQANSWWVYPFRIDEDRLGISTQEFAQALAVEGVGIRGGYLVEPLFCCEMLRDRRTYGTSGYPFSAAPWYSAPNPDDYPGFHAYVNNYLNISWHHSVRDRHVEAIAAAVRKVAAAAQVARASEAPTVGHAMISV